MGIPLLKWDIALRQPVGGVGTFYDAIVILIVVDGILLVLHTFAELAWGLLVSRRPMFIR